MDKRKEKQSIKKHNQKNEFTITKTFPKIQLNKQTK